MLQRLMSALGLKDDGSNGDNTISRRVYPRRTADRCISMIDGLMMPVVDWSQGGVRVFGDARTVAVGQEMNITLKFKLKNDLVDVQHRGQVVRKGTDNFSLKFLPMSQEIKRQLQHVIDEATSSEMMPSGA